MAGTGATTPPAFGGREATSGARRRLAAGARGQEADQRDQQQAGVELAGAIGLRERVAFGVETLAAHLVVDLRTQRAPSVDRPVTAELLDRLDGSVRRDPGHHLRVGEVAPRAAHLPQAFVRLAPPPL